MAYCWPVSRIVSLSLWTYFSQFPIICSSFHIIFLFLYMPTFCYQLSLSSYHPISAVMKQLYSRITGVVGSKKHAYVICMLSTNRGPNEVGPWSNCPQNWVRALKMLKPMVQMALEKALISIPDKKNQIWSWKKIGGLYFLNTRARGPNGIWNFWRISTPDLTLQFLTLFLGWTLLCLFYPLINKPKVNIFLIQEKWKSLSLTSST